MQFELPKIYPITDRTLSNLDHHQQAEQFIAGGAEIIQLRDKELSSGKFFEAARTTLKVTRASNIKLIINDRVDIASLIDADGVHLGQDDLPPTEARRILGENAIIGFSTHSLEQSLAALVLPINYIAIGPIFVTRTKVNSERALGIDVISKVRDRIGNFPLVAIGGISTSNFLDVLNAGADSVAVISTLFTARESISGQLRAFSELSKGKPRDRVNKNKS